MDTKLLQTAIAQQASRNLAQAQPESKPLETGVNDFKQALKGRKLKDAPVSDLQAVLGYAMMLVGIRAANMPSIEEKTALLQFVYKWYGGLTIEEIQLAFEKAVAGELETEANCYENFSCEYFGRIMIAYKQWASRQWNENQLYVPRETKQIEMNKTEDWKPLLEIYYQDYLKGKFNIDIMPWQLYKGAMELNYISADAWEDFEGNEYEAKKLAIEYLFQEAKKMNIKNLYYEK